MRTIYYCLLALALLAFESTVWAQAGAVRVLIIGVDGMSPDGIRQAETPVMDKLIREGAHSMQAQAVLPTNSSPNWASMIMGAPPAKHGIKSNGWRELKLQGKRYCGGEKGERWPTMFRVLREAEPGANIACFHHWGGFGRLVEPDVCNIKQHGASEQLTTDEALAWWLDHQPRLMFVHLDHVDGAGHHYGHGTPEYYASVSRADSLIGVLMAGVQALEPGTLVIITSDHGGKGKGHGGKSPEEVTIPWIAWGAGVQAGRVLPEGISTTATAATALYALGIAQPDCWTATPVREAFEP